MTDRVSSAQIPRCQVTRAPGLRQSISVLRACIGSGDLQVKSRTRQSAYFMQLGPFQDQALAHFPSGDYDANAAWTVLAALAHNMLRGHNCSDCPTRPSARPEPCAAACSPFPAT